MADSLAFPPSYEDAMRETPSPTHDQDVPTGIAMPTKIILDPDGDLILELEKGREGMVEVQVSSKHLTLASSVFKSMLEPHLREGGQHIGAGSLELQLPEDDAHSMVIILQILHGKTRSLPSSVPFEELLTIQVLVQHYELHEAVEMHTKTWMRGLESGKALPAQGLPRIVFMYWVLRDHTNFKNSTMTLERSAREAIVSQSNFPPQTILDCVNEGREAVLGKMFALLTETLNRYRADRPDVCLHHRECDEVILGRLQEEFQRNGFIPMPQPPYEPFCAKEIPEMVYSMKLVSRCEEVRRKTGSYATPACLEMKTDLVQDLKKLLGELQGIEVSQW